MALELLSGSRCLVTGGAGCIGSNLVRELIALDCTVVVVDDFSTGQPEHLPSSGRLDVVRADLAACQSLDTLVADADYVFHLAAQVGNVRSVADPVGDARTNVLGTVCLLEAARGSRLRKLVYSSSSAAFGEAHVLPIDEGHPRRPASFYALSKLTAESYVLLASELLGIPSVCLRYFNVYGLPMLPNEYSGVITTFFAHLERGQPLTIYGDGSQIRDFVHVQDIVQANLLAAASSASGAFNIGTGQATSILELATLMCAVAGVPASVSFAPPRAGEVQRSVAAIGRACTELGYRPTLDLGQGLAELWASRAVRP